MSEWLVDESGSDLVEYALLAATVGIMAAVALALMPGILNAVYQTWDSGTQTIWDPCDPGASSTCH
jgi:Flp pilus assembly pilin Flp